MALANTTLWEIETGGNDTNNGGAFDPGRTAGMFTDGAATSATGDSPVFTSASYAFVAGDASAWVFIASGTNWTPGWYKIASVSGGGATLTAAIGTAVQSLSGGVVTGISAYLGPNTVAGCATTASPTGATWSIDYSQQAGAEFTYTDLVSAGAGLTVSSVLIPFGKQMVGNALVITGGTNFTTGRYVIASVDVGLVATVLGVGNITTGVGANGTGGQGGALASLGKAGAHIVTGNSTHIATGTYTVTSATVNIAAGCLSLAIGGMSFSGYGTVRGDLATRTGTRPTIIASGISTFTLIARTANSQNIFQNLILNGASLTSSAGINVPNSLCYNVHVQNFTNAGIAGGGMAAFHCSATGCSTVAAFTSTGFHYGCIAYDNTFTGFISGTYDRCIADSNSGASSDGFGGTPTYGITNCASYGNGRDGFRSGGNGFFMANCLSEGNTGLGYNFTSSGSSILSLNNAAYNNTGGAQTNAGNRMTVVGFITGTASFFTDAAGGDFSLNTTAGGGAVVRAAGHPGLFPAGLTTGYVDLGATQHADPAAGGGLLRHPGMSGGCSA